MADIAGSYGSGASGQFGVIAGGSYTIGVTRNTSTDPSAPNVVQETTLQLSVGLFAVRYDRTYNLLTGEVEGYGAIGFGPIVGIGPGASVFSGVGVTFKDQLTGVANASAAEAPPFSPIGLGLYAGL